MQMSCSCGAARRQKHNSVPPGSAHRRPLVESGCGSTCVRQSVLMTHHSLHPILRRKCDGHVPDIGVQHIVLVQDAIISGMISGDGSEYQCP